MLPIDGIRDVNVRFCHCYECLSNIMAKVQQVFLLKKPVVEKTKETKIKRTSEQKLEWVFVQSPKEVRAFD